MSRSRSDRRRNALCECSEQAALDHFPQSKIYETFIYIPSWSLSLDSNGDIPDHLRGRSWVALPKPRTAVGIRPVRDAHNHAAYLVAIECHVLN